MGGWNLVTWMDPVAVIMITSSALIHCIPPLEKIMRNECFLLLASPRERGGMRSSNRGALCSADGRKVSRSKHPQLINLPVALLHAQNEMCSSKRGAPASESRSVWSRRLTCPTISLRLMMLERDARGACSGPPNRSACC